MSGIIDYKLNNYELNNLENIIKPFSYDFKSKNNIYPKNYNSPIAQSPITYLPGPYNQSAITWGRRTRTGPVAFVEPTPEEVERVLQAIHMIDRLPEDQQKRLIEVTREIRYFIDGQIRARFGATNHFNAIRCLNDPQQTDIASLLSRRNAQLAGEEYFGLNRFMENYPDIADIQWWALYENGSWHLDTWNPQGEHLDTGINGWGNLVGSILKVNGKTLSPQEMIAFYRTMRLRNERGFNTGSSLLDRQDNLRKLDTGETLPDEQTERLIDLSLVDENEIRLTYIGRSMITPTTAITRKTRQETEQDPEVRRIIHPTIFN